MSRGVALSIPLIIGLMTALALAQSWQRTNPLA
jgi:hypothetical protein